MARILKIKQAIADWLDLEVTDKGDPFDLTGATLFLGVKKSKDDDNYRFFKEDPDFNKSQAGLGKLAVFLTETDTDQEKGSYFGELKITWPGDPTIVRKSVDLIFEIEDAVTGRDQYELGPSGLPLGMPKPTWLCDFNGNYRDGIGNNDLVAGGSGNTFGEDWKGQGSQALHLDGKGWAYLSAFNSALANLGDKFAVLAEFVVEDKPYHSNEPWLVSVANEDLSEYWALGVNAEDPTLYFEAENSGYSVINTVPLLEYNKPTQAIFCVSAGVGKFLVNGVEVEIDSGVFTTILTGLTSAKFAVGGAWFVNNYGLLFIGALSRMIVWGNLVRDLTAAELTALWRSVAPHQS